MRYLAAKVSRPTGDVYVAIRVAIGSLTPGTFVNVIEIKPIAVVAALTTRYHITLDRLQASGAGPLAPTDTNRTEEGRSRNRRVELVEQ